MIPFSHIANPPMPAYRPICGICEGRSVVPVPKTMSLEKCTACNGTGREIIDSPALEAK